jgi:hypothetical protein
MVATLDAANTSRMLIVTRLLQPVHTSTKPCAASSRRRRGQQQGASQRPPSHCVGGPLPGPPPPPKKAVTRRSAMRSASRSPRTRTVDASGCRLRRARAGQAWQAEQRTGLLSADAVPGTFLTACATSLQHDMQVNLSMICPPVEPTCYALAARSARLRSVTTRWSCMFKLVIYRR